ncbi:MAG: heme ABC exporter ATP-binding protein CcmA [Gemmatimonadales bacterium]|jgi:heme ABC exporter ATP-binding subunit CcmA
MTSASASTAWSDATLLEARGLHRRFGAVPVLRGIELTLAPRDGVVVLGRNGAGKTTLLRLLAGLARPDAGTVTVGGRPLRGEDRSPRRLVGLMAHRSLLYGELTPRENLRFTARLFGLGADAVARALERLELGRHADRPVHTLSRGLIQRAALARTLLHDPRVLLLDEPFTGLDAAATERLAALFAAWREEGRAVLVVSHQLVEAWPVATRVLVLHEGRWALDLPRTGDPAEILRRYREVTGG